MCKKMRCNKGYHSNEKSKCFILTSYVVAPLYHSKFQAVVVVMPTEEFGIKLKLGVTTFQWKELILCVPGIIQTGVS